MIFCSRCGNYADDGITTCPKCETPLGVPLKEFAPDLFAPGPKRSAALPRELARLEPAGHLRRLVALFIDGLLVAAIFTGAALAMFLVGGFVGFGILVMASFTGLAYEPYLIAAKGATFGKSSVGLRVVNEYGEPVTLGQSVARWLIKSFFNGLIIPWFVPLFSERHRGLHDMIVSTYVVNR